MNRGRRLRSNLYAPDAIVSRTFTGCDAAEREQCRRELEALGTGPEGDRLRYLFERLVEALQGRAYVRGGALVWSGGQPMTNEEIAGFVIWDLDRIEDDLRELARVGLLECIPEGALP